MQQNIWVGVDLIGQHGTDQIQAKATKKELQTSASPKNQQSNIEKNILKKIKKMVD
jgi:3-dehydroquinate dehydratase